MDRSSSASEKQTALQTASRLVLRVESLRLPHGHGDNLDILHRYLKDEIADLVYLDPPFNSAQNYNAFFHEKDGSATAIEATFKKAPASKKKHGEQKELGV